MIPQAAGVVITQTSPFSCAETLLLALHRASSPKGWALPCGKVEKGETPAEAAIREALEEVGAVTQLIGDPYEEVNERGWLISFYRASLLRQETPTTPWEGTPGWVSTPTVCRGPYRRYNLRMLKHFQLL